MFANPHALLALSLLALPVLIHLLVRLKGRRVLFPTVRYLRATESHRLKLTKIERWPLLIVRLLACGLLIFAISEPVLIEETSSARAVLLLIDSSLSMNTEAAKDQARSRARETVAALGAGDVASVAQFDSSVTLLCDFTGDRGALEKGITSYGPNYGMTDFNEALTWANEKLAMRLHHKELVLISDLQAANVYSSRLIKLSGVDLKIIRIEGSPQINATPGSVASRVAGDRLEIESSALLREGERVTVTTAGFNVARQGDEASAIASSLDALLSARVIEGDLLAGVVTTNRPDEFDADDSRFFVAPLPGEKKILLVSSRLSAPDQASFIEKAVRASSQSQMAIEQAEISGSIPESADALAQFSIVVSPLDALTGRSVASAREYLHRGGSLILTAGVEANAASAAALLDDLAATHSRASFNRLDETGSLGLMPPVTSLDDSAAEFASARFRAAHSVQASDGEALLRYTNGEPAAVRLRAGAGRVVILGFGLSDKDSSIARDPVFPVFIEWLISIASPNARAAQFTTGQTPTASLLRGLIRLTKLYSVSGPVQEEISDTAHALSQPGVYEAEYETRKTVFALNPPAAESTLDRTTDSELLKRVEIDKAAVDAGKAAQAENGFGLWRVMAMAALIMTLLELKESAVRDRT